MLEHRNKTIYKTDNNYDYAFEYEMHVRQYLQLQ